MRTAALLKRMREKGIRACLLHKSENMHYLCDYTGEGCVLLCDEVCCILTDSRYTEQARIQTPTCRVVCTTHEHPEAECVADLVREYALTELALETDFISHDCFAALQELLPNVELKPLEQLPEELRELKDEEELDAIAVAAEMACAAFDKLLPQLHPGMTEKQVRALLEYEMLQLGSECVAFETIAAAGENGALPHAVPSDYVIQKGDLLTLDFGARHKGYCSDITRTLGFAPVPVQLKDIYATVLEAHERALAAVKAGAQCGEIDRIARDFIDARYPNSFGHSLGHGVGLFIHEQPRIGRNSETLLCPGHVITIEPGIYVPGLGGCRIEDTVFVTPEGFTDPVRLSKQLIEL